MAVFEEKMYGLKCDRCDKIYENGATGLSMYTVGLFAEEDAEEDGWHITYDKCYCPECYKVDDNDNVTIKK